MNGLRNCHARGVHSIVLDNDGGRLRRVFIAEKDHTLWRNSPDSGEAFSVGFHSHHCALAIRVLRGQIVNLSLREGRHSLLSAWRYQSAITGGVPRFDNILPPVWYGTEGDALGQGGILTLAATDFHTVWVAKNVGAVWLVEEGEEDPHYLPITLSDDDLSIFDWMGMYQPMSEAECVEMLQLYAPELIHHSSMVLAA